MANLSIGEGKLTLHVRGADKLWTFKSTLEIPLVHNCGSPSQHGKRVFWEVHHPEKTIVESGDRPM